jgi:GAF domain-containing protein/HAMP domain-containing protein
MEEQLKTTPQTHNAFRASLLMLGALTLYSLILFYLLLQDWQWQLLTHAGGMIVFGLMTAIGAVVIRRGRSVLGISLTLGGLYVGGLSATLTVADFGTTVGFIMVYLTLAVAGLTLPQKPANWTIGVGIVVGLINLLLELYVPLTFRLEKPILPTGALVISGILALVYIGFIIRQFGNYSLRAKLIMAFVLVTLISVGLMTFIINRVIQTELTKTVGANLKEVANSQANVMGDFIAAQVDTLSVLAVRKIIVENVKLNNASYTGDSAAIQAEIERLDGKWRAANTANDDAEPVVRLRLISPMAIELRGFRNLAPGHVEIFVTDQYGATVATTNLISDYYQADEEWWQATYNNGQGAVYIGQPEYDESAKTQAIIIAIPLYDDTTGTAIGVLRSTLHIATLTNVLTTVQVGQTGNAHLLLPNGESISADGDIAPVDPDTLAQLEASQDATYTQLVFHDALELISQARVSTHNLEKQPLIANLGWRLIVDQEADEALLPVDTTVQTALLTGLGVVLLAGLLAIWVAQILTRPITHLTTAAAQIAAGDLEVQTPVESTDEIGRLAQAFNNMTAQLRGLIGSLEDQVRDRTAELILSMKVGQHASTIKKLDELLPTITEFIREQFNLYYTQVYFVDDLEQNLILKAGTGTVGQELLAHHHSLPVGPGSIVGRVVAEGQSIVVSDTQSSDTHKGNPLLPQTRSELAIPLVVEERVIGVLDMQADKANIFTENNKTVFEAMATQLAVAINSAQQWTLAQEAQRKSEELVKQLTRQSWRERLTSQRESLGFAYDLSTVAPLSNTNLEPANDKTKLTVPVVVQNESIGQLAVNVPPQRVLSPDEENLLAAVAQQLGQKAENLRLFEQTQQRAAREQIARQIADKVRASRDIESALKTAAEELAKNLGVARAVVDLKIDPDKPV